MRSLIKNVSQKGFFHLLSSNLLIAIVAFGSQFLVAGILKPQEIGRIRIFQTYIQIFSVLAALSVSTSILKLISDQNSAFHNYKAYKTGLNIIIFCSIIVYVITFVLNENGIMTDDPHLIREFRYFSVIFVITSLNSYQISVFQALKKIKEISLLQIVVRSGTLILMVAMTYFLGLNGFFEGMLLGLIISYYLIWAKLSKSDFGINAALDEKLFFFTYLKKNKDLVIEHLKLGGPALIANIAGILSSGLDVIFINFYIKDKALVGQYGFASIIFVGLSILTQTINQITTPYLVSYSNNLPDFKKAFKKYDRLIILVSILIAACLFAVLPFVIRRLYHNKYNQAIEFIYYFIVYWFLRNISILKVSAQIALGKVRINAFIGIFWVLINAALFYFLIPKYGVIGASYSIIIGGVACALMYYFSMKSELKNV